jgi:DNA-binding transcriptional MerR regulator
MTYTLSEIADPAGVTTRALRYYDEIGLLPQQRQARTVTAITIKTAY